MTREILRWEEPRPRRLNAERSVDARDRAHGGVWRKVADDLEANPRKWAAICEFRGKSYSVLPRAITYGTLADFRPTFHFEATQRMDGSLTTVYARYVGEEEW